MPTKTRDATLVPQRFVFLGLRVAGRALADTEANETVEHKYRGHPRLRPIAQHHIEATGAHYRSCKCEQHGLVAGMSVDALMRMGAGCTGRNFEGGFVCPRLSSLRRIYGL